MYNIIKEYIEATNTHDFTNVKKLLSEDAVYYFGDASCTTICAIQQYFESAWQEIPDEIYSATNIKCLHQDASTAIYVYQYNYKGHHHGKYVTGHGRATNVFVNKNNEWLLIHEHLSTVKEDE